MFERGRDEADGVALDRAVEGGGVQAFVVGWCGGGHLMTVCRRRVGWGWVCLVVLRWGVSRSHDAIA